MINWGHGGWGVTGFIEELRNCFPYPPLFYGGGMAEQTKCFTKSPKGGYFLMDKAVAFLSRSRGEHHALYYTRKGHWVLVKYGDDTTPKAIDTPSAMYWLSKYWIDDPTVKTNSREI